MPEPQDVIDNVETQEDNPNPNTPHEPEDGIQTHKSPRKSKYNFRRNPTSNWKPDFAYYNALEYNSANPIDLNFGLDDGQDIQVLADLGPDSGLRSEN